MTTSSSTPKRKNKQRIERILAVTTLVLIAAVWFIGSARAEADLMPAVSQAVPEADHIEKMPDGTYTAWADAAEEEVLGYVAIGSANGYGGPLRLAVAVDSEGEIIGLALVDHKETLSWLQRVLNSDLVENLVGKSYEDSFQLGNDVDSITGATYTSRAFAQAALDGSQIIARQSLSLSVSEQAPPKIKFGIPEITLLALFAIGYVGHQKEFKYKKQARWASMLIGLVVLGFLYNSPLTLPYITKLLVGYWPEWQTNLYWYFLIGGILFVFTVENKNPYCEWFCPFGAAQECLGAIGGAKTYSTKRYRTWLMWAQRLLALGAILLGVFYRSPGLASYEVFGTLFGLVGTPLQFVVLGLVLVASLFVRRPWCTYICPMRSFVDFIRLMRRWGRDTWQKINPKKKTA